MTHIEFLVEEPSMDRVIRALVPRIAPAATFDVRVFDGKNNLLTKLPGRLEGYAHWRMDDLRVCVVVDRDNDDCADLKARVDGVARKNVMSVASTSAGQRGAFLGRIAVEELEAWFLGDPEALRSVFPKVPETYVKRAAFRNPDDVKGGTWEALERLLQRHGYELGGLRKVRTAEQVAPLLDLTNARSQSFAKFVAGVRLLGEEGSH